MFYDGTKLLSLMDVNGNKPEIYISTSNRSAGKTTYFNRLAVNRFKKTGSKFCLLYRFKYELCECQDKFFKDIKGLFFKTDDMTAERRAYGLFYELMLNEEPCGYAMALNDADTLKKYSHFFSDVDMIIFDEFQSESNHYCSDEVRKFKSIHTSIARGQGKQSRYVPVYMLANFVSLLNPYYIEMDISNRLRSDTNYLRGDGFVLEQGFNDTASKAIQQSAFMRAFSKDEDYLKFTTQKCYLNDSVAFIESPQGKSTYVCTMNYKGINYAVREYTEMGIVYCDNRPDMSNPIKISVTTEDHNINYVMLKANSTLLSAMRYFFDRGCFRFKDLSSKECILKALSY